MHFSSHPSLNVYSYLRHPKNLAVFGFLKGMKLCKQEKRERCVLEEEDRQEDIGQNVDDSS